MNCPKQLESVFNEVLLSNKPNEIITHLHKPTIYEHPSMNISTFKK